MIITEFRFRIVLSPMHMYLCNVMLWIAVRPMYVLVKHAMLGAEMVFDEVPITCLLGPHSRYEHDATLPPSTARLTD